MLIEIVHDGGLQFTDIFEHAASKSARWSVIRPKKRSTWLIQDAEVGVKCMWYGLMHLDHHSAIVAGRDLQRIDMRLDRSPLLCPVSADGFAPVHVTAVHAIRASESRRASYRIETSRLDRLGAARITEEISSQRNTAT